MTKRSIKRPKILDEYATEYTQLGGRTARTPSTTTTATTPPQPTTMTTMTATTPPPSTKRVTMTKTASPTLAPMMSPLQTSNELTDSMMAAPPATMDTTTLGPLQNANDTVEELSTSNMSKIAGKTKGRIGAIKAALEWQDKVSQGFNEAGIGNPNLPSSATPVLAPALLTQHKGLSFITTMSGEQQLLNPPLPPPNNDDYNDLPVENMDTEPFISPQTMILNNGDGENASNKVDDSLREWWNHPSSSTTEPPLATTTTTSNPPNLATTSDNDARQPPLTNYQQNTPPETTARQKNNPRGIQSKTLRNFSVDDVDPAAAVFYDEKSPLAYSGMDLKKFKRLNETVSRHKPFRSKFRTNPVIATNLYTCFYADTIVYYAQDAKVNGGYKYILVVVDGLSRQSFVRGMVTRTARETAAALVSIFESLDLPGHSFFMTDRGTEFYGETLKVLEKFGMTPVYMTGPHKSMIAERFM